jgi:hypothetical protein
MTPLELRRLAHAFEFQGPRCKNPERAARLALECRKRAQVKELKIVGAEG